MADLLSRYNGTALEADSDPSLSVILKQKTASFIASAAGTKSAPMVDWFVMLRNPTLKLTGALDSMMMYEEIGLALFGLFPRETSEIAESWMSSSIRILLAAVG